MNNIEILENAIKCNKKQFEELGVHILLQDDEMEAIENLIQENKELKKDKLELINKNHVVHLKDVEKELSEMRKAIDIKNVEIECLNVIHESYKEMVKENNFISKDKVKEIIYPTPENPIPFEVQTSEMYKKLEKLVEGE